MSHISVRPEFSDTLAIKSGRHPIRTFLSPPLIPNDVYASLESSLVLITGPNQSGKSTYLSQICLLTLLSHVGCFVPAEYASVRITTRLCTLLGSDDLLGANASTFMNEMRAMASILGSIDEHTLVVLDELGRGTSVSDGLAITLAICEALLKTHVRSYALY